LQVAASSGSCWKRSSGSAQTSCSLTFECRPVTRTRAYARRTSFGARTRTIGVVILSQHADPLYALALFEDGSAGRGYLLKDRVRDQGELKRALLEVSRGGTVVDPEIVNELLAVRGQRETTGLETLTEREREILALVAEGRSNADIAITVVITKRAVEGHINSIFSKLELGDPEKVDRRVKATLLYLTA
jgi:DNA-binding NarL/FixJ family response regulator